MKIKNIWSKKKGKEKSVTNSTKMERKLTKKKSFDPYSLWLDLLKWFIGSYWKRNMLRFCFYTSKQVLKVGERQVPLFFFISSIGTKIWPLCPLIGTMSPMSNHWEYGPFSKLWQEHNWIMFLFKYEHFVKIFIGLHLMWKRFSKISPDSTLPPYP